MVALPADDVANDVDAHRDEPESGRHTSFSSLGDLVSPWLRFVGPGRILGAFGAVLVLAGIAWWMLRAPIVPTESRLPLAQRAAAAGAGPTSASSDAPSPSTAPPSTTVAVVVVHVTGAVRLPGVYELRPGDRVAHAIDAAGGALADADADVLNLAAPIADGDRIAVPTVGDSSVPGVAGGHVHAGTLAPAAVAPIDLNTAGVAELETLAGVGPATAAAIVEHREAHGPYASVDELEDVRGIGPAKIEAIRDDVRV